MIPHCLPKELILNIVGIAARDSRPTALALALVCTEISSRVKPIIYRTVTISGADTSMFTRTVTGDTCSILTYVQDLRVHFLKKGDQHLLQALSRCVSVNRVVIYEWWCWDGIQDDIAAIKSWPQPREVIMLCNVFGKFKASTLPILQNVTHFYYGQHDFDCVTMVGEDFHKALPQATHIGYDYSGYEHLHAKRALMLKLWLSRPCLKMVLLNALGWHTRFRHGVLNTSWDVLFEIQDERLLVRPAVGRGGFEKDRFIKFLSEETYWDSAREKFGNWRVTVRAMG